MKKYLILMITLSLICGCKSKTTKSPLTKTEISSENKSDDTYGTIYFKATGNEPSWELKIGNEKIIFTSLIKGKENLVFSAFKPARALDVNGHRFNEK